MTNKIIARNLTARAAHDVLGNPPSTRPESGVANCYPGLEYDHRNLDRRFFPGLLFEYISPADTTSAAMARSGAHLVALEMRDPELNSTDPKNKDRAAKLLEAFQGDTGGDLTAAGSRWFIESLTQGNVTIEMARPDGTPLDGAIVWRLVRSLRADLISITLAQRPATQKITLDGWRRRYTDPSTGTIPSVFRPGELTQSLCSPWMHDFRDCACTYWASNHPDIVLGESSPEDPSLPSGLPADPLRGTTRVDWLRARRAWAETSAAGPLERNNIPLQMSHFEINERWQDLAIVLENREVGSIYVPRTKRADNAIPYQSPEELRDELELLAGVEHLVVLLYLYARYTIVDGEEASAAAAGGNWPHLVDDAEFMRHQLLTIATSEMQHLRWVNLLLSALSDTQLIPGWTYAPVVRQPARVIPGAGDSPRSPELSPLNGDAIQLFVDIERPSGTIDGRYARATATLLRSEYPRHLYELASTIARDGEQHFLEFRDIQLIAGAYGEPPPYLRKAIAPGKKTDPDVRTALETYQQILSDLFVGYGGARTVENHRSVVKARELMFDLDARAEALAKRGFGIPYFSAAFDGT
jgi:hypothetical protein